MVYIDKVQIAQNVMKAPIKHFIYLIMPKPFIYPIPLIRAQQNNTPLSLSDFFERLIGCLKPSKPNAIAMMSSVYDTCDIFGYIYYKQSLTHSPFSAFSSSRRSEFVFV